MLAHAGAADESLSVVMVFAGLWVGWVGWSRLKGRGFPRLPAGGAYALLAVAGVLVIGAAFLPRSLLPTTPTGSTASVGGPRPASTATLSITAPALDEVVSGDELDVVLDLRGGTIVEGASSNLTSDTGHIHLVLDGKLVSMTFGLVQAVDLRRLPAGEHVLEAEFVAADHAPFAPRVTAKVRFESSGSG
jgi:hypothetical protein